MRLHGITLRGYNRIAQVVDDVAIPAEMPEKRLPSTLYHTTSQEGAEGILSSGILKARDDGFVSFSEVPVSGGDLAGNDIVLEVERPDNVMKVEYNKEWFSKYPEQAGYIAGEDWEEQLEEEGKNEALFNAFIKKEPEKEWISKDIGKDVPVKVIDTSELKKEHRRISMSEMSNEMVKILKESLWYIEELGEGGGPITNEVINNIELVLNNYKGRNNKSIVNALVEAFDYIEEYGYDDQDDGGDNIYFEESKQRLDQIRDVLLRAGYTGRVVNIEPYWNKTPYWEQ